LLTGRHAGGRARAPGFAGAVAPRGIEGSESCCADHAQFTAADVSATDMGATAVRFLIERIAEPDAPPRQEMVAPPISLRNSTGPAGYLKPV
jgi:DNA-binding LacI/PurR family transcriptional regulator